MAKPPELRIEVLRVLEHRGPLLSREIAPHVGLTAARMAAHMSNWHQQGHVIRRKVGVRCLYAHPDHTERLHRRFVPTSERPTQTQALPTAVEREDNAVILRVGDRIVGRIKPTMRNGCIGHEIVDSDRPEDEWLPSVGAAVRRICRRAGGLVPDDYRAATEYSGARI